LLQLPGDPDLLTVACLCRVYSSGGARRRMPLDLLRAASLELTPSICLTIGQATV